MSSEETGGGMREEAPRISGALKRGSYVSVEAKVGSDLEGYVCDRDETGLLLDVRDPSGDPASYEFLTWASIDRVTINGGHHSRR